MAHNQDHPKPLSPSLFSFFHHLRRVAAVLTVQFPSKTVNVAWRTPISRVRHGTTAGCLRAATRPARSYVWHEPRLPGGDLNITPSPSHGHGGCPHGLCKRPYLMLHICSIDRRFEGIMPRYSCSCASTLATAAIGKRPPIACPRQRKPVPAAIL